MFLRHLERCLMLLCSGHLLLIFSNVSLHLLQWAACCRTINWDRSPRKLCRTCEVSNPCKYSCDYELRISVWEGTLRCPVDRFVSSTSWWLVWAWGSNPQLLRSKSWRVIDRSLVIPAMRSFLCVSQGQTSTSIIFSTFPLIFVLLNSNQKWCLVFHLENWIVASETLASLICFIFKLSELLCNLILRSQIRMRVLNFAHLSRTLKLSNQDLPCVLKHGYCTNHGPPTTAHT